MENNQYVLGLDLSLTKTGFAIVSQTGEVVSSGIIKSAPKGKKPIDELMRLTEITNEILEMILKNFGSVVMDGKATLKKQNGVEIICLIEGLAFGAKGTSLTQLAGLNYFVRKLLFDLDITFVMVAPTTLKKFITGSGKGDKDLMMMKIFKEYGFESLDNNEADAYALAVCGLALKNCGLKDQTIKQKEVVKLLTSQLQ